MNPNSINFLEILREDLLALSCDMDDRQFIVTSVFKIHASFRPLLSDSVYSDVIIVVQTCGAGSCYCYRDDPVLSPDILGTDARKAKIGNRFIDIALLDAAYSCLLPAADLCYRLEGTASQKAEARALLILSEIHRIALESGLANPTVTMVGAVGNILSDLAHQKGQVFATDFDPALVGKTLAGVCVEHGSMTLERIRQSDIALVTGMTLATNTFDDILAVAKSNDVKLVMFAETGGNFAGQYLKLGVESVLSETFPFYMFPGVTTLRVFRSQHM